MSRNVQQAVNQALKTVRQQIHSAQVQLAKPRMMLDFETRCELNLKDVGAFVYSRHPSCKILMVTYQLDSWKETKIWTFDQGEPPQDLLDAAIDGRIQLNAFNAFFEYCIWQHVAVKKLGWPELDGVDAFLDVQDKAKAMALPANLDELGTVTRASSLKDKEGKRLIQKFCTPRRGKAGGFHDPLAPENRADWKAFCKYGIDDTKAQVYQDRTLPDLSPKEQLIAWMTNEMNWRGLHVDVTAAKAADYLYKKIRILYNARAVKLFYKHSTTLAPGVFVKCTQRAKVKVWLEEQGVKLPNMQGDTIDMKLRDKTLSSHVRDLLEF